MKQLFSIVIGVALFLIYVWIVQQREGFETGKTPKDALAILKTASETKNGNLNLSVYKQDYQNIVTELDKYTDLTMLETISSTQQSLSMAKTFNEWNDFKKNLGEFKTTLGNMS
jgi:hypothetical protein